MAGTVAKVGTVAPRVGAWVRGRLPVGVYPDGRRAWLPLLVGRGRRAGPTVAILTGAHGNEINGPEVVGRVVQSLKLSELAGTIVVLPLTNPWGFASMTREVSIDGRDLNRSFPGHPQGSFTLQVAHAILTDVIAQVDVAIDVHDAGTKNVQLPHARVHLKPADDRTRALGLAFGSDIVILREAEQGMLAGVARGQFGVPVVTIEIGGAFQIWESFQSRAVHGVLNILRSLGMLRGALRLPTVQRLVRKHPGLMAERSGIQTSFVQLGDYVSAGTELYRVYSPHDGKITVRRSKTCGIVLGKNLMGHVAKGEQAIDVLGFEACGEGAMTEGTAVYNRSGQGIVTFPPMVRWEHQTHR